VVIYAGTNGFVDKVPVREVTRFERGLLAHLRGKHASLLNEIETNDQKIAGAIADKIKAAIEEFAKGFA
jgi:F-type H+-transporting ATPase subunit alpha